MFVPKMLTGGWGKYHNEKMAGAYRAYSIYSIAYREMINIYKIELVNTT
jgi:hypothetical protein